MADHVGSGWVMILGHPVEKRTVKLISLVSLVCVCGAAGLYYISDQYADEAKALELLAANELSQSKSVKAIGRFGEIPIRHTTAVDIDLAAEELSQAEPVKVFDPLRELLIKHIAAVGYADLPAFLIRGEYHQQGLAELPFMLMVRAPGLYRQSLELGVRKIDSGYAQGAIWSNAQQILPTVGDSRLARENRLFLLLQLSIPALAWLDLKQPLQEHFDLLPATVWQQQPVAVIRNRSHEAPILHYIDLDTALEVGRSATVSAADGSEHLLELIFAAPNAEQPIAFPSGYECRLDGNKVNSVTFSKYEFDKWLPDVLFEPKQDPALLK